MLKCDSRIPEEHSKAKLPRPDRALLFLRFHGLGSFSGRCHCPRYGILGLCNAHMLLQQLSLRMLSSWWCCFCCCRRLPPLRRLVLVLVTYMQTGALTERYMSCHPLHWCAGNVRSWLSALDKILEFVEGGLGKASAVFVEVLLQARHIATPANAHNYH